MTAAQSTHPNKRLRNLLERLTLFLEYLARMEGYLAAESQSLLHRKEVMEVKLNNLLAALPRVEPEDIDVWAPQDSSMPSEIEGLYTDMRTIEDFDLWLIRNFTNSLRCSFFVSLYSFLESQLIQECTIRRMLKGGTGRSLSDVKGKGINQAKNYLTADLGVKAPFNMHEWSEIQEYNRLRNCLVHNEGAVKKSRNETALRAYVKGKSTLSLNSPDDEIILSKEFCEEALNVVGRFLRAIVEA